MRVLFVDDEKIVREGIKTMIDWQSNGCEPLFTASTVLQALQMIEMYRPDIVITDICMQEKNGIELARTIKHKFPDIVILLLSAYEDFRYAREAIEVGVTKYLIKPLFPKELESAIKEACAEAQNRARLKQLARISSEYVSLARSDGITDDGSKFVEHDEPCGADPEKLAQQAVEIIEKNFRCELFSINKLAATLHISRGYLAKIFKRYNSKSAMEYLTDIRIERSKKLLELSNMKQSQIAEHVGYANVYYFNAQFKKATGLTPGEYRKIKSIAHGEDS